MIVSIDTGVIEPIDSLDQLEFIRRELNASVAHALTLYHYGLYPGLSFVQQPEMKRITEKARRVLGPLFDAVPLSYSFENHYHVFKATKAILNDTVCCILYIIILFYFEKKKCKFFIYLFSTHIYSYSLLEIQIQQKVLLILVMVLGVLLATTKPPNIRYIIVKPMPIICFTVYFNLNQIILY